MIRLVASAAIAVNNLLFVVFLALLGFKGFKALDAAMKAPPAQEEVTTSLGRLWEAFYAQDLPLILGGLILTGIGALIGALWLEFQIARGLTSKSRS